MSHRTEGPPPPGAEPSPLPIRTKPNNNNNNNNNDSSSSCPSSSDTSKTLDREPTTSSVPSSPAPVVGKPFPLPKLRLQLNDLSHAGSSIFLGAVDAASVLETSAQAVLRTLYASPDEKHTHPPPTRSVTLILRDMDGVAYTTGSDLDSDHKEIHFSLRYIAGIKPASRQAHEITGVIVHELVHCFQYNGRGSCPGGLVEGVADLVRLRRGLAPPHWKREDASATRWDAGYQHTAYFLDWVEGRFGAAGTVRRLNEKLRAARYEEAAFWTELLGEPVAQLWHDYRDELLGGGSGSGGGSGGGSKGGKGGKGGKGQGNTDVADEGTQT